MAKPIVAIIGATGGQGGSVASSFLADGNYTVRGITRNPSSEKALALKNKGAELVSADLNNLDSLVEAFKGASIIFAVTDFFEPFATSGPQAAIKVEVSQGINLAKAASLTPTLTHYIWSTLPPAARLTNNKYPVPHFIGKNQIDDFIKSDPALYAKTTFLWVAWFTANIQWGFNRPFFSKTSGKYLQLSPVSPNTPVLTIGSHTANVGPFVLAIAKQPSLTQGKFVLASAGAWETMGSLLDRWSKITGKETEYIQIDLEQYDRLWPQWGKEIGLMLQFWEEYGDKSWTGEEFVDGKKLGVKGLVDVQAALEEMDYSDI